MVIGLLIFYDNIQKFASPISIVTCKILEFVTVIVVMVSGTIEGQGT